VITLGVTGVLGHDAAACLLRDGELVAFAEEERFTRQKHAHGAFSLISTAYCLAAAGITPQEVDVLAASWDPALDTSPTYLCFLAHPVWRKHAPRRVYVPHHTAHAVAAAYFEGVADAAVLVVDGNGEHTATTLAKLDASGFHILAEYPLTQSLGHFYTRAAFYLGLGQHGEGKLMGVAGYGRAEMGIAPIRLTLDGYAIDLAIPDALPPLEKLRRQAKLWDDWLRQRFGPPERVEWTWNPATWQTQSSAPDVLDRADIAAAVQQALLETVVHLARRATDLAGNRTLILAGGVALNGGANAAILDRGAADRLVFFPGCHDAGGALGAAAWAGRIEGDAWITPTAGPYLGPSATSGEVEHALARSGLRFRRLADAPADAARRIAEGQVIGWFRSGMEAGPRALGNRSILARADNPDNVKRVNRIKLREAWRPFGPSLRVEDTGRFFDRSTPSPYMLEFRAIRVSALASLAGVAHVDGTTRPQTVTASANPAFHRLIGAVGEATGVPAVINTSFNIGPEPIVCSPLDAIRAFVTSDLDDLYLEDFVVSKAP
jgi:carbamoyltransferase